MRRRSDCRILLVLPALAGTAALAQKTRPIRVAWVSMDRVSSVSPFPRIFRDDLRAQDCFEDQNVAIDTWWADTSRERLQALIPEIAASRPDVIVVSKGLAVRPMIDANLPSTLVFSSSAAMWLLSLSSAR
jgi:hypothetical protein